MLERLRAMIAEPLAMPESVKRLGARAAQPFQSYVEPVKRAMAPAWEASHAWFDKREPREKVLIRAAGAILAVILLYNLIYAPIVGLRESLADRVATRRSDLIELRGLTRSYEQLQHELTQAQQRTVPDNPNFSLFSVIEQTLTKSVGRERIGSITPTDITVTGGFRQYSVAIKLNGVTLAQVVDTLYGVQSLGIPVTVSNLELHQHANDSHSYDVDMSCMALAKNG
jgi:hypothetical protein